MKQKVVLTLREIEVKVVLTLREIKAEVVLTLREIDVGPLSWRLMPQGQSVEKELHRASKIVAT